LPVPFSSVPAMRTGLHVSRQFYKQDLYRRPTVLMTMRITPPAHSGQCAALWWMNTNFRQWGVWARRL